MLTDKTYAFLFGPEAQLELVGRLRFGHSALGDLLVQRQLLLDRLAIFLVLLGGGLSHAGDACVYVVLRN